MKRWVLIGSIPYFILVSTAPCKAEPVVVASNLFQQAVRKMEAERFSEACPLLAQSYKLDPKPGTLFTLANCHDLEGKMASASARYGEYLRNYSNMTPGEQQKHTTRVGMAEARVRELAPQLPTLILKWQGELPRGTHVFVDDCELSARAPTSPLPLDPGEHVVTVHQPETEDTRRTITLDVGQSTTFDVDAVVTLVKPVPPKIDSTPKVPAIAIHPQPTEIHPRKLAGFITLGVGGASLVFGGIMGAMAISEKQTADAHCSGSSGTVCDTAGYSSVEKMRAYATPSTVGLIAGGVLATTGVVLILTAPRHTNEKPTMMIHASAGFVGVKGTFQ